MRRSVERRLSRLEQQETKETSQFAGVLASLSEDDLDFVIELYERAEREDVTPEALVARLPDEVKQRAAELLIKLSGAGQTGLEHLTEAELDQRIAQLRFDLLNAAEMAAPDPSMENADGRDRR